MGLLARVKSWAANETLTASDLNAEFDNILNNLDPDNIEDASAAAANMQAVKDPYPGAVADAPASLREEIQELRYVLKQITGKSYWYIDPDDNAHPGLAIRPKFVYCESLDYTSGGAHELVVGDTIEGETGGATAYVEHITLTSGTWAGTDAAGTLYLTTRNATAFQSETLKDNGNSNCASIAGASSKNAVVIYPFVYHHEGTSEQLVYSDVKVPFEFANLGASDWSYLYLDDSAIVTAATNVITTTQLIDATTEPAWSDSKHGWYNGVDRCIFAVFTDGSSNILEFFHEGNLVLFADHITTESATAVATSFTDISALTMPKFTTKALTTVLWDYVDANVGLYWRTNGQTSTTGHIIGQVAAGCTKTMVQAQIITDSNHIIEVMEDGASTNVIYVWSDGWFFPAEM